MASTPCIIWSLSSILEGNNHARVLPTSEQELNNLLEVQLSSLVLDWSKRVDEKQVNIEKLERKLISSNQEIEKLSNYITHWCSVEAQNSY